MQSRLLIAILLLVAFGIGFGCGGVFGIGKATHTFYHERYQFEKERIEPILQREAFRTVTIWERSSGGVFLGGEVETDEALLELKSKLIKLFGEERANEIAMAVSVDIRVEEKK